jgi:uncharacterized membrane protein YeaQ/YmgE (transglycosylase-associated protein family)
MTFEMFGMGVLVGLLAGGMAGFVLKSGGHGWIADLALGLIGSLIGSSAFLALDIYPGASIFVTVVVAFAGAAMLIAAERKMWPTTA